MHTERLGESLAAAAERTGLGVDDSARFAASNTGGRLAGEVATVACCAAPKRADRALHRGRRGRWRPIVNPSSFSPRLAGTSPITGHGDAGELSRAQESAHCPYAERDTFAHRRDARGAAVIVTGAGDNFCSGGDVHDHRAAGRHGPRGLSRFTRMTGDLVMAMMECPQSWWPHDGVRRAVSAIAMASDIRLAPRAAGSRVGLAGCDMERVHPPRIINGRAAELLYTGRAAGREAHRAGFSIIFASWPSWRGPKRGRARLRALHIAHRATAPASRRVEHGCARSDHRRSEVQAEPMQPRLQARDASRRETPRFEETECSPGMAVSSKHRARRRGASLVRQRAGGVYALNDIDAQCRALVAAMGSAGFLRHAITTQPGAALDVRAACVLRGVAHE